MSHFDLIRLLADGRFRSGEELGEHLNVSRAAVWKKLKRLESYGLDVHAVPGRGYRLSEPLQLLDETQILDQLPEQAQSRLARLELLSEIDSTNSYLLKNSLGSGARYTAALAEYQTQGRGRRGKQWVSPFGKNIYLSMHLQLDHGAAMLDGLSLVAAIAVVRALGRMGLMDAGIKWPNDIHWQGRKLAGILLDMAGEAQGPCRVVIGIGLNVQMPKDAGQAIDQEWVDLAHITGQSGVCRNRLSGQLIRSLVEVLDQYRETGFSSFMKEWRTYDAVSSREVSMHLHDKVVKGRARGIDEQGALLVETDNGLERFISGEVSLRY